MDSLIFAVNAVAPLVALVALGYWLKRIGWMDVDFYKKTNRLVFHVFLPITLFLNVYKIEEPENIRVGYIVYALVMIFAIFGLGVLFMPLLTSRRERRSAILQTLFRSNYALIGIPLADALFGAEGVAAAALLSAVIVPLMNVLAVICLSVYRGDGKKPNVKNVLLGILKNPLICATVLGLIALLIRMQFVRWNVDFRLSDVTPLYTAMDYLSRLSTPLALLALGAQFEFSAVISMKREIIASVVTRCLIVPLLGIGCAVLFFADRFSGANFATFVAVFATPVAVASVPMTQEMGGDAGLMGQLVVWTTMISAITVFVASFLLRLVGIF